MSIDLRLVAVVDAAVLGGKDPVAAAEAAALGGATAVQLRMKDAPAGEVYRVIRRLLSAVSVPVFVNDRGDVAWVSGCHGVHLGQDDVPPAPLRALVPRKLCIGISVGNPAEGDVALRSGADYWSIGPVYRTASKGDAGDPLGPAGFKALARLAPRGVPVIAIGGITAQNAGEVMQAGAAGVAVISAIFASADIVDAARAIRDVVDAARASRRGPPGSRPGAP